MRLLLCGALFVIAVVVSAIAGRGCSAAPQLYKRAFVHELQDSTRLTETQNNTNFGGNQGVQIAGGASGNRVHGLLRPGNWADFDAVRQSSPVANRDLVSLRLNVWVVDSNAWSNGLENKTTITPLNYDPSANSQWDENVATWNCPRDSNTGNINQDCSAGNVWTGAMTWTVSSSESVFTNVADHNGTDFEWSIDLTPVAAPAEAFQGFLMYKSFPLESGNIRFSGRRQSNPPTLVHEVQMCCFDGPACSTGYAATACACQLPISVNETESGSGGLVRCDSLNEAGGSMPRLVGNRDRTGMDLREAINLTGSVFVEGRLRVHATCSLGFLISSSVVTHLATSELFLHKDASVFVDVESAVVPDPLGVTIASFNASSMLFNAPVVTGELNFSRIPVRRDGKLCPSAVVSVDTASFSIYGSTMQLSIVVRNISMTDCFPPATTGQSAQTTSSSPVSNSSTSGGASLSLTTQGVFATSDGSSAQAFDYTLIAIIASAAVAVLVVVAGLFIFVRRHGRGNGASSSSNSLSSSNQEFNSSDQELEPAQGNYNSMAAVGDAENAYNTFAGQTADHDVVYNNVTTVDEEPFYNAVGDVSDMESSET